jgi:hypothetical protein
MLFHVSIEADEPKRVADVLAKIFGGEALPFPSVIDGSWAAIAGDDRGTMIEIYPRGTELTETEDGAVGVLGAHRRLSGTHFAMATNLSTEEVLELCRAEGWPAKYCRRADAFGLIQIFVEGCLMVEVLTPEMQSEYLRTVTIPNWKAMLAMKAQMEAEAKLAA